ncbi:hypothetical protein IQ272_07215 [Chroococcidiopsidales cyanobacterium LEGE 13417]|nr:hypothetical protein [Chroococcidiopsidales cyanobacterium LEGE 13417]
MSNRFGILAKTKFQLNSIALNLSQKAIASLLFSLNGKGDRYILYKYCSLTCHPTTI